jgi:hypothetical protein
MITNNFWKKTIFPKRECRKFYHFSIKRQSLWDSLKERQKIEKDAFILVTGDTGVGKSSLIANICFKHGVTDDNVILNDGTKMFIPEEDFIIDPEEFAYKMVTKQGQVLWLDEARRAANRRNWYNSIQKSIVDRKNTNRKLFNIYFLCMPYEKEFDISLSSHLTIWIWVKKRGLAEVYCKTSGKKGGSGLNIQAIIDREEKWFKENPKRNRCIPTIHPEYIGNIAFAKMNQEIEKKYLKLVEEKSAASADLTDEEREKYGIDLIKSPEQVVQDIIQDIKDGKIKDKKGVWESMKKIEDTDDKKLKTLNFYLGLEGWSTFTRLFNEKKLETEDIWK